MLCVTGENIFNQWFIKDVIIKKFTRISLARDLKHTFDLERAQLVCVTWSYNVFLVDGMLIISGSWGGKANSISILPLPDESIEFSKFLVSCNDYSIIVVDVNKHTVWVYDLKTSKYKKVNFVEHPMLENCSEPIKIAKVTCTNSSCVYLTSAGGILMGMLPTYLNTTHCMGRVCDIQCGYEHYLLLTDLGQVYTWGNGRRLQLGHGDINNLEVPTEVEALAGIKIVKIRAGGWHSLALSDTGDVYSWGWNDTGQLGIYKDAQRDKAYDNNYGLPTLLDLYDEDGKQVKLNVKDISCGTRHSALLLEDNSVWTAGYNKYGQLGLCPDQFSSIEHFKNVSNASENSMLFCGPWSTTVIS